MKILLHNVFWVLSFVVYQYLCQATHSFKIGVLSIEDDSQVNVPLYSVIENNNRVYRKAQYDSITDLIPKYDSFEASRTLCKLLNTSEGVIAVFGVSSRTSTILQAICGHFEVPYLITSWRPPNTKVHKTVLNFFPNAELFAKGLYEVVKSLQWNNFVIIYETEEGLIKMQEILKLQTFPEAEGKNTNILVKHLRPGLDQRPLLKEMKNFSEVNIILDCRTEYIIPILKQGVDLGVLDLLSSVFLTDLDAHTLDYSQLNTTTNITTIRIFDSNSATFDDTLSQWKVTKQESHATYPNKVDLQKNKIKTETVLFHDALLHLTESINALLFTNNLQTYPIDCNANKTTTTNGYTIASYMLRKNPSIKTLSKPLKFDETGSRIHFNIYVTDILRQQEIAIWHAENESLVLTRDYSKTDHTAVINLQKTTVIVASNLLEPYLMKRKEEEGKRYEGNDRFEGYSMDLINEIAKLVQFKFEFHIGHYGPSKYDDKKKKWTGLIGEILENRAHLAISDLTVTHQRREVVDFSTPYMNLGIGILYKKPYTEDVHMLAFLDPFSLHVWIYIATLYLIVSVFLYFIARMTPGDWENPHPGDENPKELENNWTIKNCMWITLGAIMTQGCDILPKGISSRMAVSVWWFFSLIIAYSYMANLTAILMKNRMEPTISSAEDLAKQNKIKYGTVDGGATQAFFRDSNFSTYKRMWEVMKSSNPSVFEDSNPKGVNRVRNTPNALYAFLMESPQIEYEIETKCDLKKVGNDLDWKHYAIAMPRNAPYRTAINRAILHLSEMGKLEQLKKKWWKVKRTQPSCSVEEEPSGDELDLAGFDGIFVVLGVGLAIALILGISEFAWNVRNVSLEEQVTYWKALKVELKFACSVWITKKKTKPAIPELSVSGSFKDERTDNISLLYSEGDHL